MTQNCFYLSIVVALIILTSTTGCSSDNKNSETVKTTSEYVDSDGVAFAPNILPEGKTFKKVNYKDYDEHVICKYVAPYEAYNGRIIMVANKMPDGSLRIGMVVDGELRIDPKEHEYTGMEYFNDEPRYVTPKRATERGPKGYLWGFANVVTGREILPCEYVDVGYHDESNEIFVETTDGYKTFLDINGFQSAPVKINVKTGVAVPLESPTFVVYEKGGYAGVKKVDSEGKEVDWHKPFEKKFLSLEQVPGMPKHFVCRSEMKDPKTGKKSIKCGIVAFHIPEGIMTVARKYDDYELLRVDYGGGLVANNAVRFYDAEHPRNTDPFVLNCNGEEAGTRGFHGF